MTARIKPLQVMAIGVIFLALYAKAGGYDLYADPIGWVLVLVGVAGLPRQTPRRAAMFYLGGLAAAVSVPLWFPEVLARLDEADPALGWAVDLPRFGFLVVLCMTMGQLAQAHDRGFEGGLFGLCTTGITLAALFPVLVFGAGVSGLGGTAAAFAQFTPLMIAFGLLMSSGHEWTGGQEPIPTAQ